MLKPPHTPAYPHILPHTTYVPHTLAARSAVPQRGVLPLDCYRAIRQRVGVDGDGGGLRPGWLACRDEGSDHSWMPGTWGLGLWRRRLQQEAGAGVAAEVHGGGGGVEEGWAGVAMGEGGRPEEEEEEHEQGKEEAAEEEGRGCRLDPKYMGRVRLVDPQFHYAVMQIFPHGAPSNGFYGAPPPLRGIRALVPCRHPALPAVGLAGRLPGANPGCTQTAL